MSTTLSFQTDSNVKNLHMALGKSWLSGYWAVKKKLVSKFCKWTICHGRGLMTIKAHSGGRIKNGVNRLNSVQKALCLKQN